MTKEQSLFSSDYLRWHRPLSTLLIGSLVLLVGAIPFFHDLGAFPIFQWDEARYVNNSLEMFLRGDFLNVRMDGVIDQWNYKPPLVLWLQVLSMKLFGASEWSVRLPSALAGVGIMVIIFWFSTVVLKSRAIGVFSVLFFAASSGFINTHTARTADLDAVLSFFLFLYAMVFIHYLFQGRQPFKTFIFVAIGVICAFLCKGIPGFFFLPFLFIISLLHNNYKKIYPYKAFYILTIIALCICVSYYWLRELYFPGYWNLLRQSEFNRFDANSMPWHIQSFSFYYQNFIKLDRYNPLIYFLPLTLTVFWTAQTKRIRRFYLYSLIIALGYFIMISLPPIKLEWYDAPLYPFFGFMLGMSIVEGVQWLAQKYFSTWKPSIIYIWMTILLLLLCFKPYQHIWEKTTYMPAKMRPEWEAEGTFLKQFPERAFNEKYFEVYRETKYVEHLDQIKFYQKLYKYKFGHQINIKNDIQQLQKGTKVLVCQPTSLDSVQQYFSYQTLYETDWCKFILLQ